MFTDIELKFFAVVREERSKFIHRQIHTVHCLELRRLYRLLLYSVGFVVWLPRTAYLLWLFKVQPEEVQEKIISYLPASDGCLAVALDLYNTERYIDQMKSGGTVTLVAVRYRFGFIVVL